MSEYRPRKPEQLSFEFEAMSSRDKVVACAVDSCVNNVVVFLDSRTRDIRRQALERVRSAGIFTLPPYSKKL